MANGRARPDARSKLPDVVLAPKPKGGRRSKQKGDRAERGLVNTLVEAGIAAERTPLSGAARSTRFGGGYDLHIPIFGRNMKTEVKHYANGFAMLYRWLKPVDILIVRADHSEPLVVMPLNLMIAIAKNLGPLTKSQDRK